MTDTKKEKDHHSHGRDPVYEPMDLSEVLKYKVGPYAYSNMIDTWFRQMRAWQTNCFSAFQTYWMAPLAMYVQACSGMFDLYKSSCK